jgi:hypothetical protein
MSEDDAEMRKLIERAQAPRSKRSTRILRAVVLVLVGVLIGVVLGRGSVMTEPAEAADWSGGPETSRTLDT